MSHSLCRENYRPRGLTDAEYARYRSLPMRDPQRMALHFRQAAIDCGTKLGFCSYDMLSRGETEWIT